MDRSICKDLECRNYGRYCRIPGHAPVTIKAQQPIAKVSEKREEINRTQYIPKVKAFLKKYPFCTLKLKGCTKIAEGVHHLEGKENIEKLLNEEEWEPACNHCNCEVERMGEAAFEIGVKKTKHKPNYQRTK